MATIKKHTSFAMLMGVAFAAVSLVQCTKDGTNAGKVSRALVSTPDSTVFGQFYDTFKIAKSDAVADVNDVIREQGVLNIIKSNCASANCHGGNIAPKLTTYSEIKSLVTPGNPSTSHLFDLITTSDLNKAMPPINYGVDLSLTEKVKIYNWIKNGAKEYPDLQDFRPAAVQLLTAGCGSGNCHNQATVGGEWARRGLITIAPTDTTSFRYVNPANGSITYYAQLKEPVLSQVWGAYKDSVRKFYADTLANASFRPYKTFGSPVLAASRRGPLNSYDDLILDINYPKALRSMSTVWFIDGSGKKFYVKGDNFNFKPSTSLNPASTLISRIDSTIVPANPRTKEWNATHQGDMAYGDGGLTASEIALIKAWYFGDPNVPDNWKYGLDGTGIFKYRKTGTIITR